MARDYVSDNLSAPHLDHLFPQMIEADKSLSTWPWFRKSIDHVWRVDRRHTDVGFINRDETAILYSNARAVCRTQGDRDRRFSRLVDGAPHHRRIRVAPCR